MLDTSKKSRVTLIDSLSECLIHLDQPDLSLEMVEAYRKVAHKIIQELATRYEIQVAP